MTDQRLRYKHRYAGASARAVKISGPFSQAEINYSDQCRGCSQIGEYSLFPEPNLYCCVYSAAERTSRMVVFGFMYDAVDKTFSEMKFILFVYFIMTLLKKQQQQKEEIYK